MNENKAVAARQIETCNNTSQKNEFDDFIYLISHDVRASVRALLELPQWISEDLEETGIKVEGSVATSIALMNKHTGRLDRMLVDLLSYSRVGRMQDRRAMNVQDCVQIVLEECPLPSEFALITELSSDDVEIGERDILTLFDALISNATKHHDKDRGRVLVVSEVVDGRLHISVSDDGPGIDEAFHSRVLGAMTTLLPRDETEGSGMGLAIVAKIAEMNGGAVRLSVSPFGRGVCVTVDLPLRDAN